MSKQSLTAGGMKQKKEPIVPYDFGADAVTRKYEDVVRWHRKRFGYVLN